MIFPYGQTIDASHEVLARLMAILAPGKDDTLMLIEAYFDESGSHHDSPVLSVAGYVFDKDRCLELDYKWKFVLDQFSLPYFRMSACAHGTRPFDNLSLPERVDVETRMIGLISSTLHSA
jgi:hypothetical protein